MAICHALYVFPKKRMSSDGIFGCGWLSDMPSSKAWASNMLTAAVQGCEGAFDKSRSIPVKEEHQIQSCQAHGKNETD
jgi:hypothetical protein